MSLSLSLLLLRTFAETLTLIDEGIEKGVDWVGNGLTLRHRYQERVSSACSPRGGRVRWVSGSEEW
jgi:hypothetical protein